MTTLSDTLKAQIGTSAVVGRKLRSADGRFRESHDLKDLTEAAAAAETSEAVAAGGLPFAITLMGGGSTRL